MHIHHLALWVQDLETTRHFYETYLGAVAGPRYHNPDKQFSSYFLTFANGAKLELMHRATSREPDAATHPATSPEALGWAHMAVSVGSEAAVDALTDRLRTDGYVVAGEPRRTGDGYYESVVLDPEGNRLELVASV